MAAVRIDLMDGHRATLSRTATGAAWEVTRTAIVAEVPGAGHAKLLNACNALAAYLGAGSAVALLGAEHPTLAGAYLDELQPEANTKRQDTVDIRMVYKYADTPDDPEVEIIEGDSAVSQEQVNTDIFGDLMTVSYTSGGVTKKQSGIATAMRPHTTITVSRKESSDPTPIAPAYVGALDGVPFTIGGLTYGDGESYHWMLTRMAWRSDDGGATFTVTYAFEYSLEQWKASVVYIDPATGRPPDDVVDGVGIKAYWVNGQADFNGLNL